MTAETPETPEILEPTTKVSKLKKFGPALFWGTMIALPAMNLAAVVIDSKNLKLELEIAKLKEIAETVADQA